MALFVRLAIQPADTIYDKRDIIKCFDCCSPISYRIVFWAINKTGIILYFIYFLKEEAGRRRAKVAEARKTRKTHENLNLAEHKQTCSRETSNILKIAFDPILIFFFILNFVFCIQWSLQELRRKLMWKKWVKLEIFRKWKR